jgi:hypothetical protein
VKADPNGFTFTLLLTIINALRSHTEMARGLGREYKTPSAYPNQIFRTCQMLDIKVAAA